jgi:hypothetical protein
MDRNTKSLFVTLRFLLPSVGILNIKFHQMLMETAASSSPAVCYQFLHQELPVMEYHQHLCETFSCTVLYCVL